jgi:tripartite-type tricarboxylate transporter receptor subunit TctC
MRALVFGTILAAMAGTTLATPVFAEGAADFYKGKTINIMVGFGAGGGYDTISRMLAKHLAGHVPGKPNIVVQNMVGAGGVKAANHVYSVAAKDGLTIAAVNQGAAMFKLLGGKGAEYDPTKFVWLGSISSSNNVAFSWVSTTGVKTIEDAKRKEIPVGGSGVISDANIYPNVLNALFGTRFKIINGYSGTNETYLAIERGELGGRGGGSYASLASQKPEWLKSGKVAILVQVGTQKEPDLPNVPLLTDLAKTQEQKQIINLLLDSQAMARPFAAPPGIPEDRKAALIAAFNDTMKDPDFLKEADKLHFDVRPVTAAKIDELLKDAYDTPKDVIAKAAKAIASQ